MCPVKRRYDASRRREQADESRRRILEAARTLLLRDGYARTTIAAIAADAAVSPQTVTKQFGNKPTLVRALFDRALVGDDEGGSLEDRDWIVAIHDEPDPRRKLDRFGATLARILSRTVPLQLMLRQSGEPELVAVWNAINDGRLQGMTNLAANLQRGRHLRRGITADIARDVLWTYSSPELYELLVLKRGWSLDAYAVHVATATAGALFEPRR